MIAAVFLAALVLLSAIPTVALWRQHHRAPDRQMRRLNRQHQKGHR